jgi:hypothetical protein
LRVEEIDERLKHGTKAWRIQHWQVIRCALVHPKPAAEIALELGLVRQTVHNLIEAYNRHGPVALETPGRGQRQRAYLSLAQEQAMIESFRPKGAAGQLSTARQLKTALWRKRLAIRWPRAPSTASSSAITGTKLFPDPVTRRSRTEYVVDPGKNCRCECQRLNVQFHISALPVAGLR